MKKNRLSSVRSSSLLTIISIDKGDLTNRLYEMGIYPDQTIQLITRAPLGDPVIVQVEGQLIMLRVNEADLITIKEK